MKKNLLFLFWLILSVNARSQTIEVGPPTNPANTVSVNIVGANFRVVEKTSSISASAKPDTSKRITIWLEAGDGYFSTIPAPPYLITGTQSHIPFLLATTLYDTSKETLKPSKIKWNDMTMLSGTAPNLSPQYVNNKEGIKIIPNVRDIVPGDTMVFAIAYKINSGVSTKKLSPQSYKLYFFYNNNVSFNTLKSASTSTFGPSNNNAINFCRTHNNEKLTFNPSTTLNKDGSNNIYQNCICFTDLANDMVERNVFVTLVPQDSLVVGTSCSVYAVLTDPDGNVLATDLIPSMPTAPAHDPNNIVQEPICLKLPKKVYPINYTVHFQNTGGGNATEVKLVVQLPKGMNLHDFTPERGITKATFAGLDYKNGPNRSNLIVRKIEASNQLEILFKEASGIFLKGTNATNPSINPETMGEVQFTINTTPGTDDELKGYADIYFKSQFPSRDTTPDGYELPVRTNIAVTKYASCDNCITCPASCYKILWLCWWWWLIILIIIIIIWIIIARRRRHHR